MRATDTQTADAAGAPAPADAGAPRATLGALTETLSSLERAPSLPELNALMRGAAPAREELRPYISFKEATYARHRVFLSEFVELLVLCWRPGQRTPIHDHNGSYGTIRVCDGVMWETLFEMGDESGLAYLAGREWAAGQVTDGADVPDIHQIGNPDISGRDLITLHMYAPPLTSLNVYHVGRSDSVSTLCMNSWNPTI